MPSRALRTLRGRLSDIQNLIDAGVAKVGKGVGRKWKVEAVWRAAIVLCCAHLEGYVEDLFTESANRIIRAKLSTSKVPEELKLVPLRRFAESIRYAQSAAKRDEALRSLLIEAGRLSHPRKLIRAADIPKKYIEELKGFFMNPWPDEIDTLFANLGVVKILDDISWHRMSSRRVRGRIHELVNRRNRIAHGTLGDRVRKAKVIQYRDFLERFGAHLDEKVRIHVVAVTTGAWP